MSSKRRVLRPYQDEAILAVRRELERSSSALIVLPTGTGKTVIMSRLASEWGRGNVLLLAHRVELLEQARDKLTPELGFPPVIEQAERGMDTDCLWQGGAVLVASVQTMRNDKRLAKFDGHPFDLILIDEAHHATARSYRKITERFLKLNPSCKILGVTATPRRSDEAALGAVFTSCAYQYPIHQAIEDGWLVPVRQRPVTVEGVDFSGVRLTRNEFGEADFHQADLEAVLTEEEPLQAVAGPILRLAEGRQGVVFAAGVAHAHLLAGILRRGTIDPETGEKIPGQPAAALDGNTPSEQRKQTLQDFADGKVRFLTNFNVLTEGWDSPPAALVAMGRPTKSLLVYTQMLGRVLRPLDGVVDGCADAADRKMAILTSDKPHALSLDFVGNSRHKIITAADVLGGNYDLEAVERAKQNMAGPDGDPDAGPKKNAPPDVLDQLKKARAELLLEKEQQARRNVLARVAFSVGDADPFGGCDAPAARGVEMTRGGSSDAQIAFLVSLGVQRQTAAGYTRRQSSAVINKLKAERCTAKQQSILKDFGHDPAVPFDRAREIIDEIARGGWRRPTEDKA